MMRSADLYILDIISYRSTDETDDFHAEEEAIVSEWIGWYIEWRLKSSEASKSAINSSLKLEMHNPAID
ncbi:hypothetical protein CFAM422_012242 [Trichoderma lentiforme]|uniref:Uncharacterized protein n=1 Tax=Trichoderma lentiforme TaxID=1567552 RepID=A0A9P4X4U6_9HYPO|nr:hypothetical protein CFAM422_012242 [Trichoderma lentiforme]